MTSKTSKRVYEQFEGVVCEHIRQLASYHAECESERKRAFKQRDMLKIQAAQAGDGEKDMFDARRAKMIDRIEELNSAMTWAVGQIKEVVFRTTTGQPMLFDSPDLDLPDFHAKSLESAKKALEKASNGDGDGEGEGDGDDAGEDPKQLQLVGGQAEPVGGPPAEPEGDDAVIASMVPGRFRDASAREYQIGDMAALQELVSTQCGSAWFWRPRVSKQYGSAIEVRKEAGRKGPVLLELMRVGDIEAPGDDPAAQAPAKKGGRGRKPAAG